MVAFVQLSAVATFIVKALAAAVGLVIGWFLTAPVAGMLSRLAFQRPVATWLMPWLRGLGALATAALAFFLVGLTGLGPGFGAGPGGGPGKGKDKGADKGLHEGKDKGPGDGKDQGGGKDITIKDRKTDDGPVDLIRIELIGGKRYQMDDRWYLFQARGPALTLDELRKKTREHLDNHMLKSARLQPVVVGDTVARWRERLLPGIEDLARELKLGIEPPDESALK